MKAMRVISKAKTNQLKAGEETQIRSILRRAESAFWSALKREEHPLVLQKKRVWFED